MKLFIGLGNYEEKYVGTRHNVGRDFLFWLAQENSFSNFEFNKYYNAQVAQGIFAGSEVEIVLPETFMNTSGESVSKYLKDNPAEPEDVFIFHDDIDMNFGDVKLTIGESGSGGHNGIKSIFDHTKKKDFNRVKIGIIPKRFLLGYKKPNKSEVSNFVLKKFSKAEQGKLDEVYQKVLGKIK